MKKTSIKKTNQVLSVLLSSCMLLSATTAASATLVTDTTQNEQIQTNLPPEHTPKTWTLTHELGGPFNYVIMPGDSVVYKGETKHSIEKGLYGQDVAWTSVDAGFSIKKYDTTYLKSNLPEIEFTTTECRNYDSIDGENTQKGDMVKTNTGFTNNTGKILRLWCTGSGGIAGYNIWSAENNVVQVAGVVFREAYVTLEAYEPEYNFSYDLQGGTVQVENLPDKYYITNEDYTLSIPAPTMAGEHFYRWSGSIPWGNSATIYPTGKAKGQSYTDFTWSLDDNSLGTCDFKDSELVANYQPGFTMSFHGMKGTVNNQSDYIYEIDKEYNKEKDVTEYIGFDETDLDISRNGYTFAGWYLDSDYTRPFYGLNDDRTYDMNGDGVYDYKDKGEPFEGSNWNMDLYAKWESAKAPEITEGSKQTWIKASNEGASFRSDAEYDDFIKVTIDSADLSTDNYTVESGSTIVKLKASYLETLTIGKHTIAIVSESGTAETEFSVETQKTDVDTTIAFKPGWTWIDISPGNKLNRANDHYGYGDLTLDSDQQYEIINEFWVRDDGKVNSSSGKHEYDIFESGRSYTYGMELKAKDGYKFNKTAKYLIKDSWHFEDIDNAICTVSEDESILTIKNMHTTTFESLDNYKVIDTIEVNNATLTFNVGDAPKFTGKEPENSKYSIVEYWRDNVNGEGICTSPFFNQAFEKHIEKFKPGVNYEYSIYFRIDGDAWEEGYRLADSVTIKINGKDIDFNIEDIDYNASVEAWTSNLISMTPTENADPDNPSNPENPNKPGEPSTPDNPSNPGEPATPDNPSAPSIPNNSSNQNGKVPQTGADNMIIWFTLGLISSTSIIAIAMYRKRKKSSK
ncbi:MAG: LPXTG cell wall anchor domain-containing protein [Pseudoruminococcus massiliensis]|uniref:LPXTG cell wall anchor domain-containing protein n=1 Tax=Pseudoruminococcus massiliensis TaxID=2086583 RepID=UPI0039921B78